MNILTIILCALIAAPLGYQSDYIQATYFTNGNGGGIVVATHPNEPGIVCIWTANGDEAHYDLMGSKNLQITMEAIQSVSTGRPVTVPTNYERPITFQKQQEGKNGASSSSFGGGWSFEGLENKFFKMLSNIFNRILRNATSGVKDGCGQLGDLIGGTYGGNYPVSIDFSREELRATSFEGMRNHVRQGARR